MKDKIEEKLKVQKISMKKPTKKLKANKKELKNIINELKESLESTKKLHRDLFSLFKNFEKRSSNWDDRLTRITEINIDMEEVLSNVLLAIRQNEYLHAWYPAQQGHPEMKVVGRHPCQARTEI